MSNLTILYILTLTSALIAGAKNVLIKRMFIAKAHEHVIGFWTNLGVAFICYAGGIYIYGIPDIRPGFWLPFFITAFLNIFIIYLGHMKAMKFEDASITAPLGTVSPVIVILTAYIIVGQIPTFWGKIGIVLFALGTYVLQLKGAEVQLPNWMLAVLPAKIQPQVVFFLGPWLRIAKSKGARLALFGALLSAVSINYDWLAIKQTDPLFFTASGFLVVALAVLIKSVISGEWQEIPAEKKAQSTKALAIGIFWGVGCGLTNTAFWYGIVPYVSSLRRSQILFTVILAYFFLKQERGFIAIRLIAAAIITAGAILIAF